MTTAVVAAAAHAEPVRAAIPGALVLGPANLPGRSLEPLVIWMDGLAESDLAEVERFLVPRGRVDIAVLATRCDGFTQPPLAAHCRGIIAGFGFDGLRAAVRLLEQAGNT